MADTDDSKQIKLNPMKSYHYVWLSAHPERTEEWLRGILAQGFHVHHMDGRHHNDDPKNLVLIESGDHMMIHNGVSRLLWKPQGERLSKEKKPRKKKELDTVAQAEAKLESAKIREYVAIEAMRKAGRRAENARLKAEKAEQSTSRLAEKLGNGLVNHG